MVRNQKWRLAFERRFGFVPDPRERERYLHSVVYRDGQFVWRGPETYCIASHEFDPREIGHVLLGEDVSRGASS
jgi:hypothetical protein